MRTYLKIHYIGTLSKIVIYMEITWEWGRPPLKCKYRIMYICMFMYVTCEYESRGPCALSTTLNPCWLDQKEQIGPRERSEEHSPHRIQMYDYIWYQLMSCKSYNVYVYIYIYIQTYRQCINIWIQMQVDSMCIRTVSIHKYTSRVCVYVYSVFYIHMCLQFCPHTYGIQQVKNKLLSQVSTLTWWSKAFSFRPWQANLHSIPKIEWIVSSPKDQWLRISDLMII